MRGLIIALSLVLGFSGIALATGSSREESSLGLTAFIQGDNDGAIAHYTKAIALETDKLQLTHLYNQRGIVYDRMGLREQALADINQAITLRPRYAQSYASRSGIYFRQGLYDQALADANKAVDLANAARTAQPSPMNNYESSAVLVDRAKIYEKLGQLENAIADYRNALSRQPNMVEAKNGLTRLGVAP